MTKRYKLKKDLPTFDAGDIFEMNGHGLCLVEKQGKPLECGAKVLAYCNATLKEFPNILENWFDEISEKPKTVWDLEPGDECYYVSAMGVIQYGALGERALEDCRATCSLFLTVEDAKKELARRRAKVILQRDAKGFKPDWKNRSQSKYFVDWSNAVDDFHIELCTYMQTEQLAFATHEDAEESIRIHKREWKIYLGVEE